MVQLEVTAEIMVAVAGVVLVQVQLLADQAAQAL
jgi:hypothetical protein